MSQRPVLLSVPLPYLSLTRLLNKTGHAYYRYTGTEMVIIYASHFQLHLKNRITME